MMLPKDKEENTTSYPKVKDSLLQNPFGTPDYKAIEVEKRKE